MLYIQQGLERNKLDPLDTGISDFETLIQIEPTILPTSTKTIEYVMSNGNSSTVAKGKLCSYFISGEMTELKRKKENIKSRSLIVLDYDNDNKDHIYTLDEIKQAVHNFLDEYNYFLYPSTSYTKEVPRIRVVLEVNKPMDEEDFKRNTAFIADGIGIDWDKTATEYARMFGLPATDDIVEYNRVAVINKTGVPFEIIEDYLKEKKKEPPASRNNQMRTTQNKGRIVQLLEEAVTGVGEGGRNMYFTRLYGTLVTAQMDIEIASYFVRDINALYCNPPLEEAELISVMKSIINREKRKEGND